MLWLWKHIRNYLEINPDLSGFLSIPNIRINFRFDPENIIVLFVGIHIRMYLEIHLDHPGFLSIPNIGGSYLRNVHSLILL